MKKSQISIIIIFGIIVLAGFLLAFFLRVPQINISYPDTALDENYINLLLEEVASESVRTIWQRGGYMELIPPYFQDTNYLLYHEERKALTSSSVESQIEEYMNLKLKRINLSGVRVGDPLTDLTVGDMLIFDIDWPVQIIAKDSIQTISKFRVTLDVNLSAYVKAANSIIDMEEASEFVDVMYLTSLGMDITFSTYPDGIQVYSINDGSSIQEERFEFIFAAKDSYE